MAQQLPLIESRPEVPAAGVAPVTAMTTSTSSTLRDRSRAGSRPTSAGAQRRGRAYAASAERPGVLLEIPAVDWHLDEHTKAVGMAGVAAARRALAAAVHRAPRVEDDRYAA